MKLKTRMKPQRHDEHRGRRRSECSAFCQQSVTENWMANGVSSLPYTSSTLPRTAGKLPSCRHASVPLGSNVGTRFSVPEGRRRRLAGGKPAAAGAAPGCHAAAAMPRRGIGEAVGVASLAASPRSVAASRRSGRGCRAKAAAVGGRHPVRFLRCPSGAWINSSRRPGAASAGADLPPANILWRPSGTETKRSLPEIGNPRCSHCVPHSFGSRSAPLCSSCLCGSFLAPAIHRSY